ncbi:hypothetical protein HDU93_007074, partial [Gonapodya sp. JEL0774]
MTDWPLLCINLYKAFLFFLSVALGKNYYDPIDFMVIASLGPGILRSTEVEAIRKILSPQASVACPTQMDPEVDDT